MQQPLFLADRAIISVSGADAEHFLNGILTASTLGLADRRVPLWRTADAAGKGDCGCTDHAPRRRHPARLRRERRARAREAPHADEAARSGRRSRERDDLGVTVFDGAPDPRVGTRAASPHRAAQRRAMIPHRITPRASPPACPSRARISPAKTSSPPTSTWTCSDGVDFRKGCFVGQEVASRMKRRGTARRRTLKASVLAGTQPRNARAGR